jgi:hypothetical protein
VSGVKLGGRESDLTIPECGLAIMPCTVQGKFRCYSIRERLAATRYSTHYVQKITV